MTFQTPRVLLWQFGASEGIAHFCGLVFTYITLLSLARSLSNKYFENNQKIKPCGVLRRDSSWWLRSILEGGNEESSVKQHSVHVQPTGIQLHALLKPRHHKPHETEIPSKTRSGPFLFALVRRKSTSGENLHWSGWFNVRGKITGAGGLEKHPLALKQMFRNNDPASLGLRVNFCKQYFVTTAQ